MAEADAVLERAVGDRVWHLVGDEDGAGCACSTVSLRASELRAKERERGAHTRTRAGLAHAEGRQVSLRRSASTRGESGRTGAADAAAAGGELRQLCSRCWRERMDALSDLDEAVTRLDGRLVDLLDADVLGAAVDGGLHAERV